MAPSRDPAIAKAEPGFVVPREAILGSVLAGGLSRRMGGGDKTLLEISGRPMLARVVERIAPQVDRLILNANGDPHRFEHFGLPIVPDTVEGFLGPLAGVLAALRHAASLDQITHVVTVAGDTPFFPADLVHKLAAAARTPDTIVIASSAGRLHPVFGLWPVALADALEAWLGAAESYSLLEWARRHPLETVDFDLVQCDEDFMDPFFNANTPEDIVIAERRFREKPS